MPQPTATLTRRAGLGLAVGAAIDRQGHAQAPILRIGVLSDMSGPYRDISGPNCVVTARQAIQDFGNRGFAVELVQADHQNKADVGVNIARQWFDQGVDAVLEVNNSAIALAINTLAREKNKVHLNSGGASSDLTGPGCSPNMVHWTTDTWANAQSTGGALAKAGAKRWYCITADYAFGHSVQREVTRVIQANGGQLVGSSVYPFPQTTDYSSFLVTAASMRPDVIALCNAGTDMINCVKQGQEFGLAGRNIRVAAMIGFIMDVHTLGLPTAQGLILTESSYWDLNDRTRALTERLRGKMVNNHMPNSVHFQAYSCALHYLKAVEAIGLPAAKASGLAAVEAMKRLPADDDAFGPGAVRADGRKIHPTYLFQAKAPAESRAPWDYLKLIATTPAEQAFRPVADGGCPFLRG
ncbi:ABC transporter permease [Siccirubricoccus deserti]|uniref:ABC transporter substrate-binding protein n=1 Tax=Siccirubricoccus deserti TaxID=2013562 RepID=A0A9X0QX27_9PROT|nr:ABC transporter substrate-binding protein [Siccirubricoccus deserti]MBC4015470.1 ABC transporter substrate-binding protein [Siccirubricoccus deserti]GGC41941.1 ABC transporter permease [Siccirubricoccus deserti]